MLDLDMFPVLDQPTKYIDNPQTETIIMKGVLELKRSDGTVDYLTVDTHYPKMRTNPILETLEHIDCESQDSEPLTETIEKVAIMARFVDQLQNSLEKYMAANNISLNMPVVDVKVATIEVKMPAAI